MRIFVAAFVEAAEQKTVFELNDAALAQEIDRESFRFGVVGEFRGRTIPDRLWLWRALAVPTLWQHISPNQRRRCGGENVFLAAVLMTRDQRATIATERDLKRPILPVVRRASGPIATTALGDVL